MTAPFCTARFYRDGSGFRFEVDATHDPVKPWASGWSNDLWKAAELAAPYIAHSTEDDFYGDLPEQP